MSKTSEVAAFKARVTEGSVVVCVENTYSPALNGQRRRVVKPMVTQYKAVVLDGDRAGQEAWGTWPTRVSEVAFPDADTMSYPLPGRAGHFVTLRIES